MKDQNLIGKRFGRLVITEMVGYKNNLRLCKCVCDCGNEVIKPVSYLKSGDTKSCGCLQKEIARATLKTHGESKTRLYRVWAGIKNRCYNPKADNYKYYGEIGITMCDEWENDFVSFRNWAYENGYDENAKVNECTLDRIDDTKGYYPNNCRWADHYTQCNNQKSNKIFTYNDMTHTMSEWSKIIGINYSTLRARISKGIPFEKAIII